MTETSDWSNAAVIMLVKEYEKRQELWKKEHNTYRVQTAKLAAWKSLAEIFSCEIPDVRKKFNSILASHRRERVKVKEGGKSTWFLYPYLKFLRGQYKPDDEEDETPTEHYEQIETLDAFNTSDLDETHVIEDQDMSVIIKEEPKVVGPFKQKNYIGGGSHSKKRLTRTLKRRPRRANFLQSNLQPYQRPILQSNQAEEQSSTAYVDSRILELQRMMKKETVQKKDDCDTFGEYIASTLRKYDKKTRCLIKQAFNNILFEQEMNEYENPLGPDDNISDEEVLENSDE